VKFYLSSPQDWRIGKLVFGEGYDKEFLKKVEANKALKIEALGARMEDFPENTMQAQVFERYGLPELLSHSYGSEKSTLAFYAHYENGTSNISTASFCFTNEILKKIMRANTVIGEEDPDDEKLGK